MEEFFATSPTPVVIMTTVNTAPAKPVPQSSSRIKIIEEDISALLDEPLTNTNAATSEVPKKDKEIPDHESEDGAASSAHYSKTKLQRMSVDALRELCIQAQVSSEGTRKDLIARLLDL